jgi:hypothetical protein
LILYRSHSERRGFLHRLATCEVNRLNLAFALYDDPLWNMALIASRLHLVGSLPSAKAGKTEYRYSTPLG